MLPNKLIKDIPDPHNAKEHYELFLRKKTKKKQKAYKTIRNNYLSTKDL